MRRNKAKKKLKGAVAQKVSSRELKRTTPLVDLGRIWHRLSPTPAVGFRVPFARPDDLLVCEFLFDNLTLTGPGGSRKLIRKNPALSATLIVELPPQSFGEQVFTEDDKTREPLGPLPTAKIRMAARSRLAFLMPTDELDLDFTLDAILGACRRWPMRLEPSALPDSDPSFDRIKKIVGLSAHDLQSASEAGIKAASSLIQLAGFGSRVEAALAHAAKRITAQATEAESRKYPQRGATLTRLLKEEVSRIAETFAPLQDPDRHEAALAALSLMTGASFAAGVPSEDAGSRFKNFPFFSAYLVPHEPSPLVTALELPYRMILSPIPDSNWWHETKPVVRNNRTELWHTTLTKTNDGVGPAPPTKVRALWSRDYPLSSNEIIGAVGPPAKPFRTSLDASDRQVLPQLMADFSQSDFVPRAATSRRLQLSALGALLDLEATWEKLPEGVSLEQWKHLATLGRDHYVRVVYRGFLCPLGHSAVLVKITERKFESLPNSSTRVAVLRQRWFIRVRERVKKYAGVGHQWHGNNFPFTSVELLTQETPNLVPPDEKDCSLNHNDPKIYGAKKHGAKTFIVGAKDCFWPFIELNVPFLFQIAATDLSGERSTFSMPLLFVGKAANDDRDTVKEILSQYNNDSQRRTASFGNAVVCYAPVNPGSEGDPKLPTKDVTFSGAILTGVRPDLVQFYPEIQTANVGVSAIQRLLQKPDVIATVTYPEIYKSGGFGGGNSGEVFLKTVNPLPLEFGGGVKNDTLGGLATPSMSILGLSRIMGPVAAQPPASPNPANIETALGQIIGNTFNPADFFKGAKILGGVDLGEILKIAPALAGSDVPKLLSRQLPDKIEARFDWNTRIDKSSGLFVHNAGGPTVLDMHGVVSSPIAKPDATTFTATASIVNFKLNLFGFITVWFDRLQFNSKSGSKPDVAVDLHPGPETIVFGGPLEFVNELRRIIPSNGFSDPPSLLVTPSGLSASYSINLPSLAVGIFALEHVSLGAGFALPFDAKPVEVRFNFAERQRPFSLTVSLLGGGGFFAIGVGTDGVREIEAALEFGAAVAINLGVASGGVEIKAGVYFHWLQTSVELAGYIRLHGELSVLGLISASLTFNLQLAYLKETGHSVVWGEATLEVEIDVLFLSFSVSVKCRREFGGSDADPKFVELIPDQPTWTTYCQAFAVEGA